MKNQSFCNLLPAEHSSPQAYTSLLNLDANEVTMRFTLVVFASSALLGLTNAFFTTNPNFVSSCPANRRYITSACWGGGTPTYGVCDDCGEAVETERKSGNPCMLINYRCKKPSPNVACEEKSAPMKDPRTPADKKNGWNTICPWAPRGPYATLFAYKCSAPYKMELRKCDGENRPGCRCVKA